jgi:hypothetical protein
MRSIAVVAALLLLGNVVAVRAADELRFVSLFDGKTMDGWKIINCEAEVQDGAMLLKSGNGVVRPEKIYRDFILELEYKALKEGRYDSGIYVRCKDPSGTFPWPRVWQVNLRWDQEGDMTDLKGARSKGLVKPNEWNQVRLQVVGTTVELHLNGQPAWKADGLKDPEGFIALQAEVPQGGQFLFRNIRVAELPSGN